MRSPERISGERDRSPAPAKSPERPRVTGSESPRAKSPESPRVSAPEAPRDSGSSRSDRRSSDIRSDRGPRDAESRATIESGSRGGRHPILGSRSGSDRSDGSSKSITSEPRPRIGGGDVRRPTQGIVGDRAADRGSRKVAETDSRSKRDGRTDISETPRIGGGDVKRPIEDIRGASRGDGGVADGRSGSTPAVSIDQPSDATGSRGGDAVRGTVRGIMPGNQRAGAPTPGISDSGGVADVGRSSRTQWKDSGHYIRTPDRDYHGHWGKHGDHHDHDWDWKHDHSHWSFSFHYGYPYYYDKHYAYYCIDDYWWHYPYYYSPDAHCTYYYFYDRWYAYPRHYYWYRPRTSFFFFVDLGDYEYRHVPYEVVEVQKRYVVDRVEIFEDGDPLTRGYAAFANQDYYEAVAAFSDALYDNPNDGLIYFARAQAYVAIGDFRAAYEDILDGMELIPDWPKIKLNLIEIYSEPIDFDRHLAELESWVKAHPRDYRAHFVLGYVYYFLQEYDLAKSELVRVLGEKPGHPITERFMDEIYERQLEEDQGADPAL